MYLRARVWVIVLLALNSAAYAAMADLGGMAAENVRYAALLSTVCVLAGGVCDFLHFRRKHRLLSEICRNARLAAQNLPDGGAEHFAKTVRAIRALCPGTTVETLTSDMEGSHEAADIVIAAHPDVFNVNIETVKELQKAVRPQAGYDRTLGVLRYVKEKDPTILTKTGFMVGLGETDEQISVLMDDILATGCDILTIGQYLQPSEKHWKLDRYATPEDFARYKQLALRKGFRHVASAPLARSSYRAWEALEDVHDLY